MGDRLPRPGRSAAAWITAATSLFVLTACSAEEEEAIRRFALPEPATDRGAPVAELWAGAWVAALAVGVVVWGLIIYTAFKFRRRSDDEVPVQTRYNLPTEVLYTVVPVIMVLVFFFFTISTQNKVMADVEDPDHEIAVVGQQWSWSFNYLNEEAVGGDTVYRVGTPAEIPTLVLPVNETVKITLDSPDVIHSFWVPAFTYKLDVIPGQTNSFSFTPTRKGTFAGKCAELCGVYHSRMLFNVEVVSAAEYEQHLQDLKAEGNVGLVLGNTERLAGVNQ